MAKQTRQQEPMAQVPAAIAEHPLFPVFVRAIEQCMTGKGERHGGAATLFMEQPWTYLAELHGRGFLTGQSCKKLGEAAAGKNGEEFVHEALGAIVYAGMSIIKEEQDAE